MTVPSAEILRAARYASSDMADRNTPLLFQEWYVAAFSDELGRELLARTLLGKKIVFYRTTAGEAAALADRCAHRSFQLSAGALEGDTVVCGYHGFRYDAMGDCIEVPSAAKCPRSIGVQRYPLIERGGLVWIWMGDSDHADMTRLHDIAFLASDAWARSKGYFHLDGNSVTETMHRQLFTAFQEDVDALAILENVLEHTAREDMYEISVASDAPSVAMRRYIKRRAIEEARAARATEPPIRAASTEPVATAAE